MARSLIVIDTNVVFSALHLMMKKNSRKDKISINQFINSAIAEKISALETADYLEMRAKNGSRDKFLAVLAKVPDGNE